MPVTSRRRFLQGLSLVPLAGCGAPAPDDPPPPLPGGSPFAHGVASGDPRARSVTLWTRLSTAASGPVALTWELAAAPDFAALVARGEVTALPADDRTVHVHAAGLSSGRTYYYRFRALGHTSPIGRAHHP